MELIARTAFPRCLVVIGIFLGSVASVKIGSCTRAEVIEGSLPCQRTLFLSLRNEAKAKDCSEQVNGTLRACMAKMIGQCLTGIDPPTAKIQLQMFMANALSKTTIDMLCGVTKDLKIIPVQPSNCTAAFSTAAEKCRKPLNDAFQKNKGSPDLCGEFKKMMDCYRSAGQANCGAAAWQEYLKTYSALLANNNNNPFCSAEQISPGSHGVALETRPSLVLFISAITVMLRM